MEQKTCVKINTFNVADNHKIYIFMLDDVLLLNLHDINKY